MLLTLVLSVASDLLSWLVAISQILLIGTSQFDKNVKSNSASPSQRITIHLIVKDDDLTTGMNIISSTYFKR